MGQFLWNGKNSIFSDLANNLPSGKSYFKENNIIPFTNAVSQTGHGMLAYTEQFDAILYPIGTNVDIFINDKLFITVQILPIHSIYVLLNPPYGNFKLRTEINNVIYRDEQYISTNIFAFFTVLAQSYNIDYKKIFQIFGNIYDKYLQDDMLYNKIGWYYQFQKPSGWSYDDYRRILTGWDIDGDATPHDDSSSGISIPAGSPLYRPMNQLFLNAMTMFAVNELCRSFTGVYPQIQTCRDIDGWVIMDDTLASSNNGFWNYNEFYLLDGMTGSKDINGIGATINTETLTMTIKGVPVSVTFGADNTAGAVISRINTAIATTSLGSTVIAEVRTYPTEYKTYPTTLNQYLHFNNTLEPNEGQFNEGDFMITGGTALPALGLEVGEEGIINTGVNNNDIITLYDEQYHNNNITLTIKKGIYTVVETVTRNSINVTDELNHRFVIDTTGHPLSSTIVIGTTTYNKNTDYQLYNIGNDYYIKWIGATPTNNTSYQVTYTYYISDDIQPLLQKIIPAYLQVTYKYSGN